MAHFLFWQNDDGDRSTYMEEVVTNIFGLLLDCGKLGWGSTLGVDQAQTGYSSREGSRAKEEKVRDFYKQWGTIWYHKFFII